jgi:hypothetical protein
MTAQQAIAIIRKIAEQNNIDDAFDLLDASYIDHLVSRINEPDRVISAKHTKASLFASWVRDILDLNDCWDSTQIYQQEMSIR